MRKRRWEVADTLLESVPGWSADQVARMRAVGMTTAAQVVALSATSRGLSSLAEQLNTSEDEAESLMESARAALSPAERAEMEEVVDTSEYGLGALPPQGDREDG
jgi:Xaa-Pro aminopeptidase